MEEEEDDSIPGLLYDGDSECEGIKGSSNCETSFRVISLESHGSLNSSGSELDHLLTGRSLTAKDEVWVVPMLIISSVSVAVIIIYQVLIICRAAKTSPSRRHLFLSQVLLLGLLLGSSLGFAYSVEQTSVTCVAIRLGTGMAYVLIYSSLLVKQVFLISLNTGVYLPAMYQALLFGFCVLVQCVIGAQWVALVPSCSFNTTNHIFSLFYIIFLVIFVSCLSIKSKHIKDNYREGSFIFILMVLKIPIWLAWIIGSIILPEAYHRACFGFGLLSICILTFVVMFLPRSRQLTAMGKEGVYLEDHEDQLSIHGDGEDFSYNQSQYSPKKYRDSSSRFDRQTIDAHSDEVYQNGSYLGFHRPLGVIPPSSSPHSRTPPIYHLPPPYLPPYPSYGSQFPSHFYPDKLYQYWHHYYPRIPGAYKRLDNEMLSTYYDRHTRDKSKSPKPNTIFYKSPSPQRSIYQYY